MTDNVDKKELEEKGIIGKTLQDIMLWLDHRMANNYSLVSELLIGSQRTYRENYVLICVPRGFSKNFKQC